MRRALPALLLALLAACGAEPDSAQLHRDVQARLANAFPGQALRLDLGLLV